MDTRFVSVFMSNYEIEDVKSLESVDVVPFGIVSRVNQMLAKYICSRGQNLNNDELVNNNNAKPIV
jgi:hypothetical protein